MEVGRRAGANGLDGDLRVVDAGEVAGAGGLVLLGLEREGVGVDTREGATGVVVEGLDLVEILAVLRLEAVLAVEDELELLHRTLRLLSPGKSTGTASHDDGSASSRANGKVAGGGRTGVRGTESERGSSGTLTEVPEARGSRTGKAPHELLDGVVVGKADLLGATVGAVDSVNTGVLDLLDEVLVTLLGEAATLLGVEVDVVSPHLEDTLVEVGLHVRGEVEIDADLVVLERDEGEIETGVAVEKEEEGEEHSLAVTRGGHLAVSGLLGLIEVKLGVEAPPLLVLLVYTLTTDGELDRGDRALGSPHGGTASGSGLQLDIHVTDEITVAGDSDGNATGVAGVTVESLLDVLHREVGVALVFRLVKGYLRVTSKVHILGTVRYELHKTTGHFESFCTIYKENNFATFREQIFLGLDKMSVRPEDLEKNETVPDDDLETVTDDEEELVDIEEDDEDDEVDLVSLMTSLLATEDGDTVCTALITIAQQLQTQNKILIKILSKM